MYKREFLKFLGLAPVGVVGMAAGVQASEPKNAPNEKGSMIVLTDNDFHLGNVEDARKVSIKIGQDGHLWLNIKGEWKRVNTD